MSNRWVVDCSQPHPEGKLVPMTAEEEAQRSGEETVGVAAAARAVNESANFRAMANALQARIQECVDLANGIEANTATPADRARAQVLCLRGVARLTRLYLELWDQAA